MTRTILTAAALLMLGAAPALAQPAAPNRQAMNCSQLMMQALSLPAPANPKNVAVAQSELQKAQDARAANDEGKCRAHMARAVYAIRGG